MQPLDILVIDDDQLTSDLIRLLIERLGHTMHWAPDGERALAKLESLRPAVIVLDLMLPYMDGHAVLQALRARDDSRNTPVLMLTGKTSEADIERALAAGATDFLSKPFQPSELTSRLGRMIKQLG